MRSMELPTPREEDEFEAEYSGDDTKQDGDTDRKVEGWAEEEREQNYDRFVGYDDEYTINDDWYVKKEPRAPHEGAVDFDENSEDALSERIPFLEMVDVCCDTKEVPN